MAEDPVELDELEALLNTAGHIHSTSDLRLVGATEIDQDFSQLISLKVDTDSTIDAKNLQKVLKFVVSSVQSLAGTAQKTDQGLSEAEKKLQTTMKMLEGMATPDTGGGAVLLQEMEASLEGMRVAMETLQSRTAAEFAGATGDVGIDSDGFTGLRAKVEAMESQMGGFSDQLATEVNALRQLIAENPPVQGAPQPSPAPAPAGPSSVEMDALREEVRSMRE